MTMAACDRLPSCEHVFGHAGEILRSAYAEMVKAGAVDPAQQPGKLGDPHPHWSEQAKNKNYPKTLAEWDPHQDPVGEHLARAEKRLRVAMDRDDPRAPEEMAIVSRWDLTTLVHDWWHKCAVFDLWRKERAEKAAGVQPSSAETEPVLWICLVGEDGRKMIRAWTADKLRAEQLRLEGLDMQPLYLRPEPQTVKEPFAEKTEPVAYVNGDELDNLLDDRTTLIQGTASGWRKTPLYRQGPQQTWQPIETAPKEQSAYPIQICGCGFRGTSIAWWTGEVQDATHWAPMLSPLSRPQQRGGE